MKYRVFRQGSNSDPYPVPFTDRPWVFCGEVEAESWDDAIAQCCGEEIPRYGAVWYEALVQDGEHAENPEYWYDENGEHGQPYTRPW